ncbi:replicative DNA helicase [Jeotgalibacillus proteolyticus]|uniref:DNA 5'-3' helicase n=1 Tax=Jeotgalibacillus proteolyticus TaxID=2082395 RepID=A0A2S5GFX4_9BACL|nr:replicative DNA helicase [Jeotgalibacillus proteolyticus]PPA71927.1 DNA helicase [Jeotgalibacillus proteolyticus]
MNVERSALGTLIKHNYFLKETELRPDHFEDPTCSMIFKHIRSAFDKYGETDIIMLIEEMSSKDPHTLEVYEASVAVANEELFEKYELIIIEKWKKREFKRLTLQAHEENWEIEKLRTRLDQLDQKKVNDHHSVSEILASMYEDPFTEREVDQGAPSGIKKLDLMTNGFQNSEFTIIAARPSMGKTDVLNKIALTAGYQGKYLPCIFSLEMSAKALVKRMIASEGHYNRNKLRDPYNLLNDSQKTLWSTTIGRIDSSKIQLFDDATQTLSDIRRKLRKQVHAFPEKKPLVLVDYLTLITPESNGFSKHDEVGAISKGLKKIAKEFDCPVIALAQLTRSVESRMDKRPMKSDLRESGSLEEDADVIIFLYRDSYYTKDDKDFSFEFILDKQRNGQTGTIKAFYYKNKGVITDADISVSTQ